jgi:hypothetical protein
MFIAHCLQQPSYGNNPDALQLMNGLRNCALYIQWSFYSDIRKNETMWFEGKWMQLKNYMLSEVSQVQKHKGHVFSHRW